MLGAWADDEVGPVLRAVLQTAAHEPSTREKLRRIVESSLIGVSQLGVDERDRMVRSGLISSQIMGLAMMRYVWRIEPVASMSDDEVVAAVAPNLQRYIEVNSMTSDELVSQDLSCRVPRQRLGADLPRRRHLVGRQSAATPRGEGSLIDHARAVQHHERLDRLSRDGILDARDARLHDGVMASRRFSTSEGTRSPTTRRSRHGRES